MRYIFKDNLRLFELTSTNARDKTEKASVLPEMNGTPLWKFIKVGGGGDGPFTWYHRQDANLSTKLYMVCVTIHSAINIKYQY